jgi:hypothetical protein
MPKYCLVTSWLLWYNKIMEKTASMASAYKILRELSRYEDGLDYRKLKLKFPFLNVGRLLEWLETLGYVSHKITAYRVVENRDIRIRHDEDDLWYPTDLGLTALDQFEASRSPSSSVKLAIVLAAVVVGCIVIFFLIWTSSS